ncbi:MAG: aminotransferase class I/II-fold pyridoxal phosphate-dependent enzyme [Chloroflexi bacterium]|nr:aminotransferase class I/II-fold pyridoxal phosphate-dependent enzyme [Chloroflexota bacterium]MBU1752215.1 aminotransferase class I/II-fold pyridoxal phosphate-dependent enzyme [Chloroflexota bacterium]
MHIAQRVAKVPPYLFATTKKTIAQMQARGIDVIDLDIGNPDLPAPPHVVEALARAGHDAVTHRYPPYFGLPALRDAICAYYQRRFGVSLDPATQLVLLNGSKEGIVHISQAVLDPGDVALLPDPGYLTYGTATVMSEAEIFFVPLRADRGWQPDWAAIPSDVARRARLIWLNYPNNPTAAIVGEHTFAEAVAFAREYDVLICHDAPYTELCFDGYVAPSFLQTPGALEVGVELNSFSKTYHMAGFRLGYMVGNADAVGLLAKVLTNTDTGIFMGVQYAGLAALEGDQSWMPERNAIYARRRDVVVDAVNGMGLRAERPLASLYVWARLPEGYTSGSFCQLMLEEAHVSLAPGVAYGPHGEGYVRFSLTNSDERVAEAMDRMRRVLA